jgi:hypothetical protein
MRREEKREREPIMEYLNLPKEYEGSGTAAKRRNMTHAAISSRNVTHGPISKCAIAVTVAGRGSGKCF